MSVLKANKCTPRRDPAISGTLAASPANMPPSYSSYYTLFIVCVVHRKHELDVPASHLDHIAGWNFWLWLLPLEAGTVQRGVLYRIVTPTDHMCVFSCYYATYAVTVHAVLHVSPTDYSASVAAAAAAALYSPSPSTTELSYPAFTRIGIGASTAQ
eukprot:scaffold273497_cov19-Tisochrysis_lutea.AAC.1